MKSVFQYLSAKLRYSFLHPQWLLGSPKVVYAWINSRAHGRVLDLGCGRREIERYLRSDCLYTALDFPQTGKYLYRAKPDVFATASSVPIIGEAVDTVIFVNVIEHLRYPAHSLAEVARVLRPGGLLLMTVPFFYPIHDAPHDYQRYTEYGIRRDLEENGLRLETMTASVNAIESTGLIVALTLGATALQLMSRVRINILFLPFILAAIPIVNLLAWVSGAILPNWPAITSGYLVCACKASHIATATDVAE